MTTRIRAFVLLAAVVGLVGGSALPSFGAATPNATDWSLSTGNFTATHNTTTTVTVAAFSDSFEPFPRPTGYAPIGLSACPNLDVIFIGESDDGTNFLLSVSVDNHNPTTDCSDNYRLNFINTT